MADLPALSEPTLRKLAVQWDTIRDKQKLTDQELEGYDLGRRWLLGTLAERPRGMNLGGFHNAQPRQAATWLGLDSSVSAARARFAELDWEYWSLWCSGCFGYEVYRDWLDSIKRQVSNDLASIWKGRSGASDH